MFAKHIAKISLLSEIFEIVSTKSLPVPSRKHQLSQEDKNITSLIIRLFATKNKQHHDFDSNKIYNTVQKHFGATI